MVIKKSSVVRNAGLASGIKWKGRILPVGPPLKIVVWNEYSALPLLINDIGKIDIIL